MFVLCVVLSDVIVSLSGGHLWVVGGFDVGGMYGHLCGRWLLSARVVLGSRFAMWLGRVVLPVEFVRPFGDPTRIRWRRFDGDHPNVVSALSAGPRMFGRRVDAMYGRLLSTASGSIGMSPGTRRHLFCIVRCHFRHQLHGRFRQPSGRANDVRALSGGHLFGTCRHSVFRLPVRHILRHTLVVVLLPVSGGFVMSQWPTHRLSRGILLSSVGRHLHGVSDRDVLICASRHVLCSMWIRTIPIGARCHGVLRLSVQWLHVDRHVV
jgi:hypothetical protein